MLPQTQRDVHGLSQEQGRQGHVDVGAIQIEALTRGTDEARGSLVGAQPLELLHHLRKNRRRKTRDASNHLDQPHEGVGKGLQGDTDFGPDESDGDPEDDGDQHLDIEQAQTAQGDYLRPRLSCLGVGLSPRGDWCGRSGSNRHSFRNRILSPARLPIPPRPQSDPGDSASAAGSHPTFCRGCLREALR